MKNGKKTVWVVDDDISLKNLIREVLEGEGYQVTEMQSSAEIYSRMENEKPDLIILDIVLGKENGISICQKLKKFSSVPVVLVSGTKFKSYEVINSCADSFMQKPFTLNHLITKVSDLT